MSCGELVRAREALQGARQTFQDVGFTRSEALNLNELARLERLSGDFIGAERYARRALELLTEMEAVPEQALAHRELALSMGRRDEVAAERNLRRAIQLYEACGEIDHAADTYRLLGDLLERQEPHSGADAYRAGLVLIAQRLERND
jgi:tetratricopeptide (TPR) repeat protein